MPGAARSLGPDALDELLTESDYVVLCAPLTPETHGLIGARELDLLGPAGVLVNVARGALVDTDALVAALRDGRVGGAFLDVTEPEPLPDGHPLWSEPRALITPHVANTRRNSRPRSPAASSRTSRASGRASRCSAWSIRRPGTE